MRKITNILGVPFDVLTMNEAVDKAVEFLNDNSENHIICTPNPEIVMIAQNDAEFMEILKNSDMVIPDGVGIVWASKYSNHRINERVAGFDLTQNLIKRLGNTDKRIYFFGGAPGVAKLAAQNMSKKYNVNIVGTRNGYFNKNDENEIIENIKNAKPDLLLVGLGAPKQEKWIYENIEKTGASLAIGIGGSFDVMAGNVKRAPAIFQKLGLEWFYRLICQPTRFKRILILPKFVLKVISSNKK